MNTKHTLISLCEEYNSIEVPIIQRDYAQGRVEQENLRNRFIDYLVDALANNRKVELDFVYGNIREDQDRNRPNYTVRTFIPIDGQQRLTTLWLLHWFLAFKEGRVADVANTLKKFVYETRPSAHDFCRLLIDKKFVQKESTSIDKAITNQPWFDNEWLKDGTVNGMLQMLHTFESYPELVDGKIKLSQLLSPNDQISFYFVELKEFGLSEEMYIRMNARGKILTDFENFKSEFYRIIKNNDHIDEIKDKMEYQWVENLWPYRDNNYLVDNGFMNFLSFISKMLYFKEAKARSNDVNKSNFIDLRLLKYIYSSNENVDFLIDAFDNITAIKSTINTPPFWQGSAVLSLSEVLENTINGKDQNIENQLSLYATLVYLHNNKGKTNLPYFIRVIRNLAINTADKSEREWPRILRSIETLSKVTDIRSFVASSEFNNKMTGFRESQCEEEHFKALLPTSLDDKIFMAEDNNCFKGNIAALLASCFVDNEKEINRFEFKESLSVTFDIKLFENIYNAYVKISKNDFDDIWGDLLCTDIYYHNKYYGRLYVNGDYDYKKAGAMLLFAKRFAESKIDNAENYSIAIEKRFVQRVKTKYEDLKTINNVREQLYLLYIITRRINKKGNYSFFKGNYNFGWIAKESGYSSLFNNGIEGDYWFKSINPIFQTYNAQFRYNMGLYQEHAIDIEIGQRSKYHLLDKVVEWANSK